MYGAKSQTKRIIAQLKHYFWKIICQDLDPEVKCTQNFDNELAEKGRIIIENYNRGNGKNE